MSSADNNNIYTGNNIQGPVTGNYIIKLGPNSVIGSNVFH
jgi:hypothetical protein